MFVEGDTDKVFYERLILYLKEKSQRINNFKIHSVRGIGNYSSKVPGKFKNEIYKKYHENKIIVFCSYDLDVFKFNSKPPINWNNIKKKLITSGADSVHFIKAENMIEDWFLLDIEGICKFLKITKPKKIKGKDGYEKMKILFKKANKIYEKGTYTYKFLDQLNFDKIYNSIKDEVAIFKEELFISDQK